MYMIKRRAAYMGALIVSLMCLCGCQKSPDMVSVVSKNNGGFDSSDAQERLEQPEIAVDVNIDEIFCSTDESVDFTMQIYGTFDVGTTPVAKIMPHYLSSNDAKMVANALLGETEWYEQTPMYAPQYSKDKLQKKVIRWSQYSNAESLRELLGTDYGDVVQNAEIIKNFISEYTQILESTSENIQDVVCGWKFHKDSYYSYSPAEFETLDSSNDNDVICAVTTKNGIDYTLTVSSRNQNDFKVNNITLSLGEGISPLMIDENIYRAQLCRTEKPTNENISAVSEKAQSMLDKMGLGNWMVDASSVQTTYYGDTPEYVIVVSAVPVIENVAAIRVPQLSNLKSNDAYSSNYYISDATFHFSANGDLVYFKMYSPIDIKEVAYNNVDTLPITEIADRAKNHLMLSDRYAYGLSEDYLLAVEKEVNEHLQCKVDISRLSVGLLRVKASDSAEEYYYVPGYVFGGSVDYIGDTSDEVYAASGALIYNSRIVPLVAINAIDGSIISLDY